MSAHHEHAGVDTSRSRLLVAIGLVLVVLAVQVVGAAISGSLALLADAGHMLSDLVGLVVALLAVMIAARPATDRQTFGYRRAEVIGAMINGLILIVVAVLVVVGAIDRLVAGASADVQSVPMLVAAAIGLVANASALMVLRPAARNSINMRGAYLEVFGDLLGAIAVIVAALVIMVTGAAIADPIASLVIAALIVPRAFVLLRDVLMVLSEAAPVETDVSEIRRHLARAAGVIEVHDVHVWAITSGVPVFTAHIVVEPRVFVEGAAGRLLDDLTECLADHFDVAHSTFQLEPAGHNRHEGELHR